MKIQSKRDFNAGLLFIAIASVFIIYSQEYPMGTATRMGPGYFPMLLACLLFALGLGVLGMAFVGGQPEEPLEKTDWRALGLILGSVASFAVLLPYAGFVLSVCALVGVAALASEESSRLGTLGLALVLAVLGVLVFGVGLELQFPIFPPAFSR